MNVSDFKALINHLAEAWTKKAYEDVAHHFSASVLYTDPLRYTLRSRTDLLAFFQNDDGCSQQVTIHHVVFDEHQQLGTVEYTYCGTHQYHGTVWVRLEKEEICEWREYQHVEPRSWADFFPHSS